jgi:uncharacterized protein involved in exopolysaccharide biosynthesis
MSSVRPVPDLDAEAEVDLGQYARRLVVRWWLLVVGLVAGAIVGYLTTVGGSQFYRASALVYMGQPLGALSGTPVQALQTNPSSAGAIVTSEAVVQRAARRSGLSPGRVRSGTSVNAVAGSLSRVGQSPLVQVTVRGPEPEKVRTAANVLANVLVERLSPYAQKKIRYFAQQRDADLKAIEGVNQGLARPNLSFTEKLLLQTRLQGLQSDLTQTSSQLTIAEEVEAPSVVERAAAAKTSVRSHRNATAVGAVIGLILGAIAALLWEPIARARAR